jgi:hypothetical protein
MMSGDAGDFWCIQEDIKVPDMEKRRPRKPGERRLRLIVRAMAPVLVRFRSRAPNLSDDDLSRCPEVRQDPALLLRASMEKIRLHGHVPRCTRRW